MRTIEYLSDPAMRGLLAPGVVAALSVGVACSLLSVLTVLKGLSFVGQGVSHSAMAGVGLAAALGVLGGAGIAAGAEFGVVLAFCVGGAVVMALAGERRDLRADTVIGIYLVSSMALGAVLVQRYPSRGASWSTLLFGQIMATDWVGAGLAAAVACGIALALWLLRRPMLFWAFDEQASPAFGVPHRGVRVALMVLLAASIVTGMKVIGVVLVSALLILPGAAALRLSRRLWGVVALAVGAGVLGVAAGVVASLELDLAPGSCIVLVLTGVFLAACVAERVRARLAGRVA